MLFLNPVVFTLSIQNSIFSMRFSAPCAFTIIIFNEHVCTVYSLSVAESKRFFRYFNKEKNVNYYLRHFFFN